MKNKVSLFAHMFLFFVDNYIIIDCPGQVELYSHSDCIKNVMNTLENHGYRVLTENLFLFTSSHACTCWTPTTLAVRPYSFRRPCLPSLQWYSSPTSMISRLIWKCLPSMSCPKLIWLKNLENQVLSMTLLSVNT